MPAAQNTARRCDIAMASAARGAEEEVFETPDITEDGREQQAAAARSESALSKTAHKVPDAEMVDAYVPPQAAFEVFMGRTYAGAREDMSDVVGTSSTPFEGDRGGGAVYEGDGYHRPRHGSTAPGEGGGDGSIAGGVGGEDAAVSGAGVRRRTGESPMQRLVRLREETAMLAEDLEEMFKARDKGRAEGEEDGAGGAGGGDPAGYALWSAMARETESLQRQLATLSGDPRFKHIISSSPPPSGQAQEALQQRLSEGVVKALEGLRETAGEGTTAAAAAVAAGDDGATGTASSVTYELFLNEASEARRRFGPPGAEGSNNSGIGGISGAEARIAALERALGGVGGEAAGGAGAGLFGKGGEVSSLTDVVASLENRVSVLEPGRIDALRQKAQLAKADLDGLAKSRTSASSSSSASRNKKLEEAFATLETWQGIAAGLPALVERLQALEALHLASASFAQRLEQVETGQTELEVVLKDTNEGLVATRDSVVENVTIVNDNVKALDRRLAGVGLAA